MGDADALGILAVSVVYPVSFGTILVPAAVFFGGIILEHLAAFFLNLRYNIEDLFRGDCFSGVQCPRLSKVAAFYSIHRKRPREKFVFCAE